MFRSLTTFLSLFVSATLADFACYDPTGSIGGSPNSCVCTDPYCDQSACEAAGGTWTDACRSCSCSGVGGGDGDGDGGGSSNNNPGCFSGDSMVNVQGAPKRMRDLKVGDMVRTGKNIYQPIYAFGHRDIKNSLDFIKLSFGKSSIELSKEHMIYLHGKSAAVRADTVKEGDMLLQGNMPTKITKVSKIHKKGMYAPLTSDGTILVDGVKASTYVAFHTKSSTEEIKVRGVALPFVHQDLNSHWAMSPLRIACTLMGSDCSFCQGEHDTIDGYNPYVAWGKSMIEWTEQQTPIFQVLFFYAVTSVLLAFYGLEIMLMGGGNPLVQVVLFFGACVGYTKVYKRSAAKKTV